MKIKLISLLFLVVISAEGYCLNSHFIPFELYDGILEAVKVEQGKIAAQQKKEKEFLGSYEIRLSSDPEERQREIENTKKLWNKLPTFEKYQKTNAYAGYPLFYTDDKNRLRVFTRRFYINPNSYEVLDCVEGECSTTALLNMFEHNMPFEHEYIFLKGILGKYLEFQKTDSAESYASGGFEYKPGEVTVEIEKNLKNIKDKIRTSEKTLNSLIKPGGRTFFKYISHYSTFLILLKNQITVEAKFIPQKGFTGIGAFEVPNYIFRSKVETCGYTLSGKLIKKLKPVDDDEKKFAVISKIFGLIRKNGSEPKLKIKGNRKTGIMYLHGKSYEDIEKLDVIIIPHYFSGKVYLRDVKDKDYDFTFLNSLKAYFDKEKVYYTFIENTPYKVELLYLGKVRLKIIRKPFSIGTLIHTEEDGKMWYAMRRADYEKFKKNPKKYYKSE